MTPISEHRLHELLARFAGKRALVVGDIALDEYIWGKMTGISPEGPVPVVYVHDRTLAPGAAANTAAGLAELGAIVTLCGCVGDDPNGKTLTQHLKQKGVDTSAVIAVEGATTSTNTKINAGGDHSAPHEVLRTHTAPQGDVSAETQEAVIGSIQQRAEEVDAIILADQAGSVVTRRVIDYVIGLRQEHGMLVVGDSRDHARDLRGIDLVVANDREAGQAVNLTVDSQAAVERAGEMLIGCQKLENVIITRGKQGMSVFSRGKQPVHLRTYAQDVFDVTGAGDTVTAATTLALLAGGSAVEAAQLANIAAGVAVSKVGTVAVSPGEILDAHAHYTGVAPSSKIKSLDELKAIVADLRRQGYRIAWTNGCFDILHSGHISYLRQARQAADVLVLGVSGDATVTKLKGPDRPINDQQSRAELLAEMACIDYVIIFEEESPAGIIEKLEPDVYIKGGDYTIDTINQTERRIVEAYGGEIQLLGHVEGTSTTDIIATILRKNQSM